MHLLILHYLHIVARELMNPFQKVDNAPVSQLVTVQEVNHTEQLERVNKMKVHVHLEQAVNLRVAYPGIQKILILTQITQVVYPNKTKPGKHLRSYST